MTPVIGGEIRRRLDLPGQEAASEGTVGDKRDAQFPDGVEQRVLRVAAPERASVCSAEIGWTLCARRIVCGAASDRPR